MRRSFCEQKRLQLSRQGVFKAYPFIEEYVIGVDCKAVYGVSELIIFDGYAH